MNEQTVKPCPFCGGCGATAESVEAWNRRASPEPSPTARKAAEKGVDTYLRAVANKEDFDLYDIFANAFRDFVRRDEFEKLGKYAYHDKNCAGRWYRRPFHKGDSCTCGLDAILRRKP
jgi:hypothetical protein